MVAANIGGNHKLTISEYLQRNAFSYSYKQSLHKFCMKIENTFYIETVNMNDITNQQKLVMEDFVPEILHLNMCLKFFIHFIF